MRVILLFLAALCLFPAALQAGMPNIVIIFADDQGYQDLGCFGSPHIKTPNIDGLAKQGIRFTDFYSGYCVCSASRASLLTGSYQARISMPGVLGPRSKVGLHPDEITIADMLKQKDYATCMIGKWHIGDKPETLPTAQGFDTYFGLPYSNDMARQKDWGNDADSLDKIWRLKKFDIYDNEIYRDKKIIEKPVNQVTLTDRYTDEAVKFIDANHHKPFYLHFCHAMPHVPLFVGDDRYDPDPKEAYRLTIEHIDHSVGRILKTLDDLGVADNTLLIYTSDNGPWLSKKHHGGSALPLRAGKATTYEGGMRVPCVMRWPAGIVENQICREVAATIDILPTIAKIVGVELPSDRPIDGREITGLFKNANAKSPHASEGFYYYRNTKVEAVRIGHYKLHLKKPAQLYDLSKDVSEEHNLTEKFPELVTSMTRQALSYHQQLISEKRPIWRESIK